MTTVDDRTLMAYVDGELETTEADRVREMVRRDADLQARVQVFEASASMLRESFHREIHRPVPGRLEALLATPTVRQRPPGWVRRLNAMLSRPPGLALTAALLLVVGVGMGHLTARMVGHSSGLGADRLAWGQGSAGWNRGFETTPTSEAFTIRGADDAGNVSIVPLATFLDGNDRFCRSFQQSADATVVRHGIACRGQDGHWTPVVVVAEMDPASSAGRGDGTYRPASATGTGMFQQLLDMQMTTSPFEPGEERALIENGWHLSR